MPKDLVSERRHRHSLRRKAVRKMKMLRSGGSGKFKNGSPEPDSILPPGHPRRPGRDMRGPKKFKWKRDVLAKIKAREVS